MNLIEIYDVTPQSTEAMCTSPESCWALGPSPLLRGLITGNTNFEKFLSQFHAGFCKFSGIPSPFRANPSSTLTIQIGYDDLLATQSFFIRLLNASSLFSVSSYSNVGLLHDESPRSIKGISSVTLFAVRR